MDEKLKGLKEAYLFYKKVLKDKDAMACGCLMDAEEWLFRELNELFENQE
jgi:hypothetical protein|nr:MAG TPA: Putative acyl-CoA hydrolase [Caudoviricetes sp.]